MLADTCSLLVRWPTHVLQIRSICVAYMTSYFWRPMFSVLIVCIWCLVLCNGKITKHTFPAFLLISHNCRLALFSFVVVVKMKAQCTLIVSCSSLSRPFGQKHIISIFRLPYISKYYALANFSHPITLNRIPYPACVPDPDLALTTITPQGILQSLKWSLKPPSRNASNCHPPTAPRVRTGRSGPGTSRLGRV